MRTRSIVILSFILGLMLLVSALAAQDDARPFLGITFDSADDGAVITSIIPDSAAASAGLEKGDIITAVNGATVSADDLAAAIGALAAGDNVTLDVMRGDETLTFEALLQTRPERFEQPRFQVNPFEGVERPYLGVSLETTDDGLTIAAVAPDSPAAKAGLEVGDIITAINDTTVEDAAAAAEMIAGLEPGATITLDITRDGEAQSIDAVMGSRFQQDFEMVVPGDMAIFDGSNWRIVALSEDSALAAAGLQAGDTVTAINGENLDPSALAELLADTEGEVVLTVERDGETLEITVMAADLEILNGFRFFGGRGEFLPFQEGDIPFSFDFAPANVRLGVLFQVIDETVAADNDLSVTEGALLTDVLADSAAADAGLQIGDVVTAVDGDTIDAERTLRDRLLAYEGGDTITLDVLRGDETLSVDVTLEAVEMNVDRLPFLNDLPFSFGDDGLPRFFFGPDREFRFDPVEPAPNV